MEKTDLDKKLHKIRFVEGILEYLLFAVLYYITYRYYGPAMGGGGFLYRGKYVLVGMYVILTYLVFRLCDSMNIGNLKIADLAISQSISILIVNFITYFQICLIANKMLPIIPMAVLTLVDAVLAVVCSLVYTKIYQRNYIRRNMVLIYGSQNALTILEKFGNKTEKYLIAESVSADKSLDELCEIMQRYDAVVLNDIPVRKRNDIVKYCYCNKIRTYMVPRITDVLITGSEPLTLFDTPLNLIDGHGIRYEDAFFKRCGDILISFVALIPGVLVMGFVALAIKIEDGGPVFYKQKRVTLNDRDFEMLKFRSMVVNAEEYTGAVLAEEDDPRITKVGRFLRKHRIDELPQLVNVLKGDMSIVGPRPERRELINEIVREMPEFAYRTKVKGGLTGYAQVYGKYNTTAYDKLKMDLMYIEKFSLLLDIKLILMTPQILFREESTEGVKK